MSVLREFTDAVSFRLCSDGLKQIELKHYDKAVEILFEAVTKYPQDMPNEFYYATALACQDKLDEALIHYRIVEQSKSEYADSSRTNIERIEKVLQEKKNE